MEKPPCVRPFLPAVAWRGCLTWRCLETAPDRVSCPAGLSASCCQWRLELLGLIVTPPQCPPQGTGVTVQPCPSTILLPPRPPALLLPHFPLDLSRETTGAVLGRYTWFPLRGATVWVDEPDHLLVSCVLTGTSAVTFKYRVERGRGKYDHL